MVIFFSLRPDSTLYRWYPACREFIEISLVRASRFENKFSEPRARGARKQSWEFSVSLTIAKIDHCAAWIFLLLPRALREIVSISGWKECTRLHSNSSISEKRTAIATESFVVVSTEAAKVFGLCLVARPEDCLSFFNQSFSGCRTWRNIETISRYDVFLAANKICRVNTLVVIIFPIPSSFSIYFSILIQSYDIKKILSKLCVYI